MKKLRSIDKRLLLTIISVLIGLVGLWALFYEPKANISIVNISDTNVLDIHKPLEDLSIYFQGEDIQEKNLGLRIYTLRIINDGGVNILQNHYDVDDIWGIQVKNGDIVEVRLVDSNSDYILSNLNPQIIGEQNVLRFQKVIFEKRDFFTIEILILYEKTKLPEIIPLGKIAGVDKLTITKSQVVEEDLKFVNQLFYGTVGIQIVRFIVYLGGFFLVLFIIAILVAIFRTPRMRRAQAAKTELSNVQSAVIALMVDNGLTLLPNPVTVATNDMTVFPDTTAAASKGVDPHGNTYDGRDKAGFILYQHDIIGGDASPTIGNVNYVAARYTLLHYSVDSQGTVSQHDITSH